KEAEPVKKGKRVKRPAKKSTTAPTVAVAIIDTLGKQKDFHISQVSGSGDGTNFESWVPDEKQPKTSGTDKGTDDNNDDSDDDSKGDDNNADSDDDYDEEEHDEEYEYDDDNENVFEEKDDDLYKDVDVRSLGAEQEQERKGNEEMTDTISTKQSSSVSADFASKFLILENIPPAIDEVNSMMNVEIRQEESSTQEPYLFIMPETTIPDTSTAYATTVPPTILMIFPPLQLMTPSPTLTTVLTTTLILALPDFSSLLGFDQRVSTLETKLSQLKQADHSTQLLESSTINESLENVVLTKSSSQPKSTYEAAVSLTEFELKKILLDKIERSKSYKTAPEHKELYERLFKSYNLDKDLFSSYGNVYSLKRDRSSKGTKSQSKSSGKSVQAEELVFKTADTEMPQDQGDDTEDQPNVETTPMDKCDDDYDEEEHDEEYEYDDDNENVFEEKDDDLYKDVDVRSLGAEQEQERKGNEEMTDTISTKQSSSVSADFASKFLILENIPPAIDEVNSMMNVKIRQEESSTQEPYLFIMPETAIPDTSTAYATTVPPTILMIFPPLQLMTPSPTLTTVLTTTLILALPDFSSLLGFDQRVSTLETKLSQLKQADHSTQLLESSTINESLENVVLTKSSSQPKSTYEAAVSLTEFELKKILLDKIERSKSYKTAPEHKELYERLFKSYNLDKDLFSSYGNVYSLKRDRSSKGTKSQSKSSGKSVQAEELVFKTADTEMPQDQGDDTEDQPNVETTPMDKWFKKLNKPLTLDHDWNDGKSIDSRPPQKWISNISKASQPPRTFDEIMSTPIDFSAYAAKYDNIEGIKDMVMTLWSPVKVAYDKFAMWGISHWGPKRQKFYVYASNRKSKHDVFSRKRIIAVTHVKVMKLYGYGYLEEIIVRREDQTLHKFKEGDFPRLNLHDIKDFFTSLGPKETRQLRARCHLRPECSIKDVHQTHELYKFCDGTLTPVRNVLHDIANNPWMEYLPKIKWCNLDRKRSCVMIKAIDQQLFKRRLLWNLEKFIGGREYENDFRLLERTI
nr:hypothetical protein [Tanacetum cinerariifolium]